MRIQTALISVSDRTGLAEFARGLSELGIEILSTGGTGETIQAAGVSVLSVSEYTGFPEILDGRVKTLHPRIHAGILARLELESHRLTLQEKEIRPIGLVVVNLYPFRETISREGVTRAEAIEQIDIGGPTLIRAAAKNGQHVAIVVSPGDYETLLKDLQNNAGQVSEGLRKSLAAKAFNHTALYDMSISNYLSGLEQSQGPDLPEHLFLALEKQAKLRYGENPHQMAGLYASPLNGKTGLMRGKQLQGKELSFNNYLDLDAAYSLSAALGATSCAIIKHTNPCGAAMGDSLLEAYQRALECDPLSAFGSIIGLSTALDAETAQAISELFVEAIVAPGFSNSALDLLGRKKNLRLVDLDWKPETTGLDRYDLKRISGGFLLQGRDAHDADSNDWKVSTQKSPSNAEWEDLQFAWQVVKQVKSNAIVFARKKRTCGIGAGQMSRVDSVRLASTKAQLPLKGAVMASDAFFPFPDAIEEAAAAGISAIVQPGGSIRDEEVIQTVNDLGLSMVLTGKRHFRH